MSQLRYFLYFEMVLWSLSKGRSVWCHFELIVHWSIKRRGGWEQSWARSQVEWDTAGGECKLDRWVDEKTGTHRKMFSDDAAKKGERLWCVPIATNNQRNNNCENKPQKERLKAHRDLSGILFTVILKLSHGTIIDLTILHLCSCISIQIIYI